MVDTLARNDEWIRTTCNMCYNACGIRVHVAGGVAVKIEGDPENPQSHGRLCAKGHAGIMEIYDPHRLKNPVKRTNTNKGIGVDPKWVEISWDEALATISDKLLEIRNEDPRKLVLGGIDFQTFTLYWTFASAFGTPNVWKGASDYYCGNGVHPVAYWAHASFYAEPDLRFCNHCMLVGSQLGFMVDNNANHLTQLMADARLMGMKVVVVDPIGNNSAAKADDWVPIKPGTDAALMLGMLNLLLNDLCIYDAAFLRKHTNASYLVGSDGLYVRDTATGKPLVWDELNDRAKTFDAPDVGRSAIEGLFRVNDVPCQPGFQFLKDHVKAYPPEKVSQITTVPASTVRRLAKEFGEAARVGSTIVVEGKELPYRPACATWNRGVSAHKHGMLTGWAVELLNIVVGAIDVPGGLLGTNSVGPYWAPHEGPDGLLVPSEVVAYVELSYPARKVEPPETLELRELFPVAPYSSPVFEESVLNPDKFGLHYKPEMWIQLASNALMSTSNPKRLAEVFKKVPFVAYFAAYLDETSELADIVLPDTRYLERLVPFPTPIHRITPGLGDWHWNFQQPVSSPPANVRPHVEVLLELADRAGFLKDFYVTFNSMLKLKEPYRLDTSRKYAWHEIVDIWQKARFGPEHGLDWFKEHGLYVSGTKKVEEAYPRPFLKPRIPVYLEHLLTTADELRKVTREMDIPWDVSDYQPVPDWKPCPAYEESSSEYDMYVVNYKLPFHTFSGTAQNPWLNEMAEHHPYAYKVTIPAGVATARGIKDGDVVWVESADGRLEGKAKVSECIHPQVVGVAGTFGGWAEGRPIARGKGMHFNSLLPYDSQDNLRRIDMVAAALDCCIRVKVYKKSR